MELKLEAVVNGIEAVSPDWRLRARAYLNNLAIPPWSLGRLLDLAEQLAAIKQTLKPSVGNRVVVTMAGDHGVVEEGVSTFPQEVTLQMVYNFVAGGAGINVIAKAAGEWWPTWMSLPAMERSSPARSPQAPATWQEGRP